MTPDLAGSTPGAPYDYTDYFGRVAYVSLLLLAAPAWVYLVARAATPGALRCLACAPALAALLLAPFLFSYEHEPLSIMAAAYLSERLPATKVLAFCLGRGPLQEHLPRCGLIHFIALTLCPVVLMAAGPAAAPSKPHITAIAATQQQPQQSDSADAAAVSPQQQQRHVTRATRRHRSTQLNGGDPGGDPGGPASAPSQTPARSPRAAQHPSTESNRLPDAPHAHTATVTAAGGGGAGSCRPQGPLLPTSQEQLCTGLAAKACVLLLVCVLAKLLPTLHVLARSRPMQASASAPLPDQSCHADIVASLEPSHTAHTRSLQLVQQLSRSPTGSALLPWAQLGAHLLQGVQVGRLLLAVGMFCAMAGLLELLLLALVPLQQAGMQLAAPFNAPHRATSLAEFWSMRWNVPQTQLLKALVYDPIIEGCLVKQEQQQAQGQTQDAQPAAHDESVVDNVSTSADKVCSNAGGSAGGKPEGAVLRKPQQPPALLRVSGNSSSSSSNRSSSIGRSSSRSRRRRAVAVVATFLFSGLEHLLFYWYVTRMLYLPWLLFFTMHGLLMVVESQVRRAARQRAQPPQQLSDKLPPPQRQQQHQGMQQRAADNGLSRCGCDGSATLASPEPVDVGAVLGGGVGTETAARLGPEVGDSAASEQQEGGDTCSSSITSSSSSSMSGNTAVSAGTAADAQWGADAGEQSLEAARGADGLMGSLEGGYRGRLVQGAPQRAGSAQAGAGGAGGLPAAGGALRQLSDEAAPACSGITQGHQGKASHVQEQQLRSVRAAVAAPEGQQQQCQASTAHSSAGHQRQPGHTKVTENGVPNPQPLTPRKRRQQSSGPQQWLCAAVAHPAVWNVMTLVVLHASACWGFYGALEHPELVARVTRATCSLPGSSHWGPWLMSADACTGW